MHQGNDEWGWALLALFLLPMLVHLQFLAPRMCNCDRVEFLFGAPRSDNGGVIYQLVDRGWSIAKDLFEACTKPARDVGDFATSMLPERQCCQKKNRFENLFVRVPLFFFFGHIALWLGVMGVLPVITFLCVLLALVVAVLTIIVASPFVGFVLFLPLVLMDVAARLASSNQRPWPRLPTSNQAPTPTRHHPATTPSPPRPLSPPSSRQCPF